MIIGVTELSEREKVLQLPISQFGYTVTGRIRAVKQPWGGYIRPRNLMTTTIGEGMEALNQDENIHPSLVGSAVDYLTRFITGSSAEDAFSISLMGAKIINEEVKAKRLLNKIKKLDDKAVVSAVKLSGFDVCYRASIFQYVPIKKIKPNQSTIENIITMVKRSCHFFDLYGPKVLDGISLEGAYTDTVIAGDIDFLTKDTLWEFKVSKAKPKKYHTLQLLMYWRMGLRTKKPEFRKVKYLGIYNPRLNTVSRISVHSIPRHIIRIVEEEVIGYKRHNTFYCSRKTIKNKIERIRINSTKNGYKK